MSEKDVWVRKRTEEEARKGKAFREEEEKGILGCCCCCCSAFVVAVFTRQTVFLQGRCHIGWLKRQARAAPCNQPSQQLQDPAPHPLVKRQCSALRPIDCFESRRLVFLRCSTFELRSALEGHRRCLEVNSLQVSFGVLYIGSRELLLLPVSSSSSCLYYMYSMAT